MKTICKFIVFFILLTGITGKTWGGNKSLNGIVGELPEEIIEVKGIGGWINSATNDENGNVFISQSNRVLTARLDSPVTVITSTVILGEARSMSYDDGQLVCSYFVFPEGNKTTVTTFQPDSNPEPEHISFDALSGIYGIARIVLKNGYLYVAEMEELFLDITAIHIFDWTSGPNNNGPIGSFIPENSIIYDFAVDNNLIYLAGNFNGTEQLVKVNTENKGNPFESFSMGITNITSVVFDEGFIYVGRKSGFGNDGLKIIRRSDNTVVYEEPIFSSYDIEEMFLYENRIYSRNNQTLVVTDATPTGGIPGVDPQILGSETFNLAGPDLQGISGGKIYYIDEGKFGTIDVTNPENMFLSGGFISPRAVVDQDVNNHVMVVADDLGDVFTYRFDDPEEMELVSTGNFPGVTQVFINEDKNQCFIYEDFEVIRIANLDNLSSQEGFYRFYSVGATHIDLAFSTECCFAAGAAFEIFSLNTNEGPDEYWPRKRYSHTALEGTAFDISRAELGNGLFIATSEGVSIFNIESVTDPRFITTIGVGGDAVGMQNDGDYSVVCSTDEEGTWLSAYEDLSYSTSANQGKLLVKQKISNVVATSENNGNLMAMVDGLILVIIENRLLSFTYLPENNVFMAGATFEDETPFQNIKAHRQYSLDKSTSISEPDNSSKIVASMKQGTNGTKTTEMENSGIKCYFTNGHLEINIYSGGSLKVGRDEEGYVTINGRRARDEHGNYVLADQVTRLTIVCGCDNVDVEATNVSTVNFPNLTGPLENMAVSENANFKVYYQGNSGAPITITVGDIGGYYTTMAGNDIINVNSNVYNHISTGAGDDKINYSYNNYIYSGSGNDCLKKFPYNDQESSGTKSASLISVEMPDFSIPDSISDESGTDTLDFRDDPIRHTINLDLPGEPQIVDENGWSIILNGQFEYFYGGPGSDRVTIKPLDVPRFVDGGGSNNGPDTLIVWTLGLDAVDNGNSISIEGYAPIVYSGFSSVILSELTVSSETVEIPAGQTTANLPLTSTGTWRIECDQTWLTFAPASGSGNATITLITEENIALDDRIAILAITGEGGLSETVAVTQKGAEAFLSTSVSSLVIEGQEGSVVSFDIFSNTNWTLSTGQEWLIANPVSGSGNTTIVLTTEENIALDDRIAILAISGEGGLSETVAVTQRGAEAFLSTSVSSLIIDNQEGSEVSFDISSNVSWTVSTGQAWLEADPVSGSGNATVTLVADENNSTNQRETTVTIYSEVTGLFEISVTQTAFTVITDLTNSSHKVYPNPADDYIILNDLPKRTNQIHIYNVQGYLCLYKTVSERMIDIKGLPSGAYILKITYENKIFNAHFLKR